MIPNNVRPAQQFKEKKKKKADSQYNLKTKESSKQKKSGYGTFKSTKHLMLLSF